MFPTTARRPLKLCEPNLLDMNDDLLAEPLEIKDGRQRPRLGIEIDEDELAHYRPDS